MHDVVIVGGGVVGCCVLHTLTQHGYRCVLLEKHPHLISGASAGNSAIATQAVLESNVPLETQCLVHSHKLLPQFLRDAGLPYRPLGALLLAWDSQQLERLPALREQAVRRGVEGARLLTQAQVLQLEPEVNRSVRGGLLVPGEGVLDSWLTPVFMAHQAHRAGAQIRRNCEVTGGQQLSDGTWELDTAQGKVKGRIVINAAGLYGDTVEELAQPSNFSIQPRKGQYVVFSKAGGSLLSHVLMAVPTQTSKGVIVFPSVYGNVVVGPTAEDVCEREQPRVCEATLQQLTQRAHWVLPALKHVRVVGSYAGLRPATDAKDYHIYANKDRHWVTVGGIRSTGVSACLGIAAHVRALVSDSLALAPAGAPTHLPRGRPVLQLTGHGCVVMDGVEYKVTHPLSRLGLQPDPSRL